MKVKVKEDFDGLKKGQKGVVTSLYNDERALIRFEDPNDPLKVEEPTSVDREQFLLLRFQAQAKLVGQEDELMVEDPERSESDGSDEEDNSYFDLVKKFTTKKTLPEVDHDKIDYPPFKKNFYIQVKEITAMKEHEVEELKKVNGEIRVRGKHCPRPIKSFLQCGMPD